MPLKHVHLFSDLFLYISLFIYFWLCWVLLALWAFSSCCEQGLLSGCGARASCCSGFSCSVAEVQGCVGFSSCSSWGLAALRHVESSWTRNRTHVPCIGRGILNHQATREVLSWQKPVEDQKNKNF